MKTAKRLVQAAFNAVGYELVRRGKYQGLPPDVSDADRVILRSVAPFTMTSVDRQVSLIHAVRHIVRNNIPGCFVECGVWRGGSAMAIALTLSQEGRARDIYLYDTFEGATPPTDLDRRLDGMLASDLLKLPETAWYACIADLADVQRNLQSTGYENIRYVKGPVEQTIPSNNPGEPIALLRLDTDWYESTRHELTHLYPLVSSDGVLIVDDYGFWDGARRAVDEYFAGSDVFLHRIDDQGRLIIKK